MWQQVCLKNKDNISRILGNYIESLQKAKISVDAGNETALTLSLNRRGITETPCQTVLPAPSKNSSLFTAIS